MIRYCACLLLIVGAVTVATADDPAPPNPQSVDLTQIVQMMAGAQAPTPTTEPSSFPDFKEVTKGMVSKDGLFVLWFYPPDAKDKDSEKLLCQIPAGFLGEQFMLSTSFSGGGFLTGFPLDERVVKWQLLDRQLLLIEPETRFVIDRSKEVSDVVRRTYPDRIRVAVPLVTKAPNGDPVIDLGALLKSNFADIGWTGGGGINGALSKWTTKKTFPLNVEIGVELAVASMAPPGSYDNKLVHYSFWKLPQTDYQPRAADDRVGYFLTVNQDWSKPANDRDIFNRYIDRWQLVKRDPSLKLCDPRQPIVFYIEKTVPVKYRQAVRDGILEWNRAFEKIGFLNAIEVRQQTNDNEWKDLDPEDMRYSFFRWIVTGAGFAMGPHRANPFTGQIYDADIIFDDSMVRYQERELETYLPTAITEQKLLDPTLAEFAAAHPNWGWYAGTGGNASVSREADEQRQLRQRVRERMHSHGLAMCDYMEGMKHQMALARTVLADRPPEVTDRFLYDCIKETVTHEVGHTLGLRHNFKASSVYSLDEIKRRRTTDEPTCGSVMDYNPALLLPDNPTKGHFITPTIGPYDYWAIEYGYRPFDSSYQADQAEKSEKSPQEPAGDETKTTAAEASAGDATAKASTDVIVDMSEIPPEVLEKMPPEMRQMIAAAAAKAGGNAPPTSARSGGPKFAAPPAGEAAMLEQIAGRAAEPELAYATDEDTTFVSPDPKSNRFDMGSDPVEWANERLKLIDERMANIMDWAVKDQESWYFLRQAYVTLISERTSLFDTIGRYVGGQYFVRSHRGDADAASPFVLVEPARQRAALRFTVDHLYRDAFYAVPPALLNHLAPSRWSHDGVSVSYSMDFPIHAYIAQLQRWNLMDRLYPGNLRRIHDNEMKTDAPDKLTVAEYLGLIQNACWADALDMQRVKAGPWSDTKPFVSDVRRSLEREYLGLMEPLVREEPGWSVSPDLHAMLQYSLQELSGRIGAVLDAAPELDFASRAHLTACKSRIDRILKAELKEYGQ